MKIFTSCFSTNHKRRKCTTLRLQLHSSSFVDIKLTQGYIRRSSTCEYERNVVLFVLFLFFAVFLLEGGLGVICKDFKGCFFVCLEKPSANTVLIA